MMQDIENMSYTICEEYKHGLPQTLYFVSFIIGCREHEKKKSKFYFVCLTILVQCCVAN